MADADTEDKRRSAISFLMMTVDPVPDGVIDTLDRVQAAWEYSGITPGGAIEVTGRRQGLLLGVF